MASGMLHKWLSVVINDEESLLLDVADISQYNEEGALLHPSSRVKGGDKPSAEWIAYHRHLRDGDACRFHVQQWMFPLVEHNKSLTA
jgi:hypothetical protein